MWISGTCQNKPSPNTGSQGCQAAGAVAKSPVPLQHLWRRHHPLRMLEDVAGVTEPGITAAPGFKAPEKPNYCF